MSTEELLNSSKGSLDHIDHKSSETKRDGQWSRLKRTLRSADTSPFVTPNRKVFRRVEYDIEDHWAILTQLHGSTWPHVLPYCLFAVLEAFLINYAKKNGLDLTYPAGGHKFMSILVSFLVVTRTTITYNRFMSLRHNLGRCFQSCRELIQFVTMLTMTSKNPESVLWRREVAIKTVELIRITVAAIEYESSQEASYDIVPDNIKKGVDVFIHEEADTDYNVITKWAHGKRTAVDENWRAPIVCAYNLKAKIMEIRQKEILDQKLHVNEELNILGQVANFVTGFHDLKSMLLTPYPFPLVQMERTLLFFWVFTLPFVIINTIDKTFHVCFIVFLITYGFLGLEYVSIELADPFGDDPNDFDCSGLAQIIFEDIYIILHKFDGADSAEIFLRCVTKMLQKGDALDIYANDNKLD